MPGTVVTPKLTFMAIVTLILMVTIRGASIYLLVVSSITAGEYLAIWSPMMNLALGYLFGSKQGAV